MKLFRWFKQLTAKPLNPEAQWTVVLTADGIAATDHCGNVMSASTTQISKVAIETNDSGPWGADVWWLLFGQDDALICMFPLGATGEPAVIDTLMSLPAFDSLQMTNAMKSTHNAIFPVWERQA